MTIIEATIGGTYGFISCVDKRPQRFIKDMDRHRFEYTNAWQIARSIALGFKHIFRTIYKARAHPEPMPSTHTGITNQADLKKDLVAKYFSVPLEELPDIIDLRGLEAPEPMEKILMACVQMGQDDYYLAHLPHVPDPLFPILKMRGLGWQVFEQEDESALVLIRKRS